MVNRPKNIGTKAETAVVRALQAHGFPGADRLTLRGAADRGDILVCDGVILEVKGGNRARSASDNLVSSWLEETERERVNAGADIAALVVVRSGVGAPNAHRWWAVMSMNTLSRILLAQPYVAGSSVAVWMQVGDFAEILRNAGYGR